MPFYWKSSSNEIEWEVKITELTINNLSFAHFYFKETPYKNANIFHYGFYALKNQLKKEDYFNYFFKEINNKYHLKENLEKIKNINELFYLLNSVNCEYERKEISLLRELRSKDKK